MPIIEIIAALDAVGEAEKVRAAHWVHLRSEVVVAALE
jgi:hypothetical protein